jgi:predicted amidohydrolase
MKIALAQLNFCVGDLAGNTARILDTIARARDELGARLVAFPELAITGYPPEDLLLRPGLHRRVEHALRQIMAAAQGINGRKAAIVAEVVPGGPAEKAGIQPGDVVWTGTPGGVGEARGRFLRAGDVVETEIAGIGRMRNPVVER